MTIPRGEKTPLGKELDRRGIGARELGEAVAVAEEREKRIEPGAVTKWIYGVVSPSPRRCEIIAKLLQQPKDELFPPKPKRRGPYHTPSAAGLQLIEAAEELKPDLDAAAEFLTRAVSQQTLAIVPTNNGDSACIIEHSRARRRRAAKAPAPARRAA